jgi:hypothetical protein
MLAVPFDHPRDPNAFDNIRSDIDDVHPPTIPHTNAPASDAIPVLSTHTHPPIRGNLMAPVCHHHFGSSDERDQDPLTEPKAYSRFSAAPSTRWM